jgi:hypothetical protein
MNLWSQLSDALPTGAAGANGASFSEISRSDFGNPQMHTVTGKLG